MSKNNFFLSEKPEVNGTSDEECMECQTRKKENDLPKARLVELLDRALLEATGGDENALDGLRKEMNQRVENIIEKQKTRNTSK